MVNGKGTRKKIKKQKVWKTPLKALNFYDFSQGTRQKIKKCENFIWRVRCLASEMRNS